MPQVIPTSAADAWSSSLTLCPCGARYASACCPKCGRTKFSGPSGVARGDRTPVAAKRVRPRGAGVSDTAGESGGGPTNQDLLTRLLDFWGLPRGVLEHHFTKPRMWRFDRAWPEQKVALEIDGGAFVQGRHTSGPGFRKDAEKMSEAAARGWRVLRLLPEWLTGKQSARTASWIRRALQGGAA